MNKIKIRDLKTLYELRKTKPFAKRMCSARIFYFEEKMGVSDSSCFLWPVFLTPEFVSPQLNSGDLITFSSEFLYTPPQDEKINTKYDDLHFTLHLLEIVNYVPCLENLQNLLIGNPIPNLNDFKIKNSNYTCYYQCSTKKRFHLISKRSKAMERVKQFFTNRNFLQVETPTLVPSGGLESYLNPFTTEYTDHRGKKIKLQMPTSPEFALKKILTEMTPQIFQISRSYRNNGELSQWHEPEFFMLEWYRIGASLKDILNDTQNLVLCLAEFLGSSLDVPKNWSRFRVDELFKNLLKLDLNTLQQRDDFYKAAKPLSFSVVESDTWNDIFCKLFMEKIEPYLKEQKACFVTHYPVQMAALAAAEEDTHFAQRGEAFLYGVEICNAYLELVDAKSFQERILKTKAENPSICRDPIFENAMNFGLPPCAGNALGLDRVIALLLGEKNISSLYPIPFLSQFVQGTVAAN